MIDRRHLSLAVAVFVVVAALSGGATVALLSDSATVTTAIGVGNSAVGNAPSGSGSVPLSVVANVDEPDDGGTPEPSTTDDGDGDGDRDTANASASDELSAPSADDGSGVSIAIEPERRTVTAGSETKYEVVVTGATDGIGAYDLTVTLSDTSVAQFEDFTHAHEPDVLAQEVTDGELDVSVGLTSGNTINGTDRIVLGTITVAGTGDGRADLTFARGADGTLRSSVVDGELPDADRYDVNATHNGTITVEGGAAG